MLKAVLRDPFPLIPLEKNELAHAIRHMLYISYILFMIYITRFWSNWNVKIKHDDRGH